MEELLTGRRTSARYGSRRWVQAAGGIPPGPLSIAGQAARVLAARVLVKLTTPILPLCCS